MGRDHYGGCIARAWRSVLRAPKFALSVIGSWTLGLAAAIATYAVADAYFFRPPAHVSNPDLVVRLYARAPGESGGVTDVTQFSLEFLSAVDEARLGAQLAAYRSEDHSVWLGNSQARLNVAAVSAEYFTVMGVRPFRGRLFSGNVDDVGTAFPIVLKRRVWQKYFRESGPPTGQIVRIGDLQFSVVGTVPDGFTGGEVRGPDAWVPLESVGRLWGGNSWRSSKSGWLRVLARLDPETDLRGFETAASVVLARALAQKSSASNQAASISAAPLSPSLAQRDSPMGRALLLVSAAGVVLLLISSINAGGLFLLRGLARHRQMLICRALGASIGVLIVDVIAEVILLLSASTILAVTVVLVVGELILALFVPDAALLSTAFRLRTTLIGAGAGLTGLLTCGLIAMVSVARGSAGSLSGMDRVSGSRGHLLLRLIVGGQSAATAVLVAGSLLLASSLYNLRSMDLGLDISDVTLVSVGQGYALEDPNRASDILTRLAARLQRQPAVRSASLAISAPFYAAAGVAVNAPDHPEVWRTQAGVSYINAVSSNYFSTFGIKLLEGRLFSEMDSVRRARVVIINETFAKIMRADREPIGRCIVLGAEPRGQCSEVVGIVADSRRYTLVPEDPLLQVYILNANNIYAKYYPTSALLVKVNAGQRGVTALISHMVREEAPPTADIEIRTLEELVDPQVRPWRTSGRIWGAFAVVATLLTCVGIYAALAYVMEQQRRDIAIRQALGATSKRLFIESGFRCLVTCYVGVVVGCITLLLVSSRGLLPLDTHLSYSPFVVLAAGMLVATVVTVASAWPIFRVSRLMLSTELFQ